ncbi:MAG: amidase family protein [Chloroflexota bacterium]
MIGLSTDTVSVHSPAVDLLAAMRRRELGSLELLDAYLDRIERFNSDLNAVVSLDRDGARKQARAADEAMAHGRRLGPLHGLPMTIKDALLTRGMRSTGGAVELADFVPDQDAPAVATLRAAGAIIFGKTNVPTWSGDTQSANAVFGRTRNPWRDDLSPGGSSGGAAAAVAAGLTAAELGTDLGGSLRIPASHCGIFGHKPSYGVVSSVGTLIFPGSEAWERDLEVVGPLARSAADLELLLEVLAGSGQRGEDRPALASRRERAVAGWRLAARLDEPGHPISREVRAVLDHALNALAGAGATIDSDACPLDDLDHAFDLSVQLAGAALALSRPPDADLDRSALPIEQAMAMSHRRWLELDDERRRLRRSWGRFCDDFEVVLCPVSATTATPHDHQTTATRFVDVDGTLWPETAGTAWNVVVTGLHLPATVVPVGLAQSGLPVGLMVVGRFLDDWTTLRVARRIADIVGTCPVAPGFTAQFE